jgi:hypothetical protein
MGRKLKIRVHLSIFILQRLYNLTDRKAEYGLRDNAAYQLFCGVNIVEKWSVPDHTKIEKFRNRLSPETQRSIAKLHKVVKKEVYAVQDLLSKLSSDEIAKLPWNIRHSFDQITMDGKRYLLDVAHFIRTNTIKYGKLLSFHAKEVACIVKNKAGKPHEFGRVFQIGRIAGNFVFTCLHTSIRMDDKSTLKPMLEEHGKLFPKVDIIDLATDKGYFSKANEDAAEEVLRGEGNLHLGYQYEDTPDDIDTRLKDHRAGLEAVIGHIKQGGQLKKSRMKSDTATLAAGYGSILGFNLRQLIRHQGGKMSKAG